VAQGVWAGLEPVAAKAKLRERRIGVRARARDRGKNLINNLDLIANVLFASAFTRIAAYWEEQRRLSRGILKEAGAPGMLKVEDTRCARI
jgi:hypothetical protein